MKPLVWTIRVVGRVTPSTWVTHEGPETTRFVERHVETMKAAGFDVVVNLSSKPERADGWKRGQR